MTVSYFVRTYIGGISLLPHLDLYLYLGKSKGLVIFAGWIKWEIEIVWTLYRHKGDTHD